MNRYVVEGIVRDVLAGKRVGLVAGRQEDARTVFALLLDSGVSWEEVRKDSGMEMVRSGTGAAFVLSATTESVRGRELDVVVLLDGLRPLEGSERRREFLDSVSPTRAELVFCE